jgi:hypothetical protein
MTIALKATASADIYRRAGATRTESLHLSSVPVTPPVSADVQRLGQMQAVGMIQSVVNVFECFVAGEYDIVQGDVVAIGSERYIVRGVSTWLRPLDTAMQLMIESVRK